MDMTLIQVAQPADVLAANRLTSMEDIRMDRRPLLRIKVRNLADEAKLIRSEERKPKNAELRNYMTNHRKGIVRKVARETALALAYLNGTPYAECENPTKKGLPDFGRIKEMVARYGTIYQVTHFEDWVPKE